MKRAAWLAAWLVGCHAPRAPQAPPDPFVDVPYAQGPAPRHAKVFLVAGGDDIANFAAEVLEQRTLWRRAGLREEQIVCYWAKPTATAWAKDHAQYGPLALALKSCRAASPAVLAADLRAAATEADDFVYLYVTGHGLPSQLRPLERSEHTRTQRFVASLSEAERAVIDPAAISLHAGDGPNLGDPRGVVAALRRGTDAEALVFTPRTLAPLLAAFDDDVHKIVVLQACFAGGFIDHHAHGDAEPPSPGADALLAVPNLTVLTATSAERPSFGCASGNARTYFGGAYNLALARALEQGSPASLPWQNLHEQVVFAIEAMEAVHGQRPSLPGLFESTAQPGGALPSSTR